MVAFFIKMMIHKKNNISKKHLQSDISFWSALRLSSNKERLCKKSTARYHGIYSTPIALLFLLLLDLAFYLLPRRHCFLQMLKIISELFIRRLGAVQVKVILYFF